MAVCVYVEICLDISGEGGGGDLQGKPRYKTRITHARKHSPQLAQGLGLSLRSISQTPQVDIQKARGQPTCLMVDRFACANQAH